MNIFIDFAKGKIEKVNPAPIYFGNNNVDKITLYFKNVNPEVEWYPALSALGSDNDTVYPRLSDTSGTGTKTIDGVDYIYYEFTLSSSNGWNLTPGKTLFYVWINYPNTNGNQCMGTFGCTILGTSGYYKVDNLVVNPELREYLETSFQQHYNEVDEKFEELSNDINTSFNELEEEFNDEYTEEVNAQRDLINNLIGGEPRYVNTSSNILALTSNKGVAVATDNGHWYYWDGEQYVDSGMDYMQSVIPSNKLMNLAEYCNMSINDVNKTLTIGGSFIFTKSGYISTSNISVKTISYDGLSNGTYYCYIRNNTLYISNISVDCQMNDVIIWIVYITNNNINIEVFNAGVRKPLFALSLSGNVTIDTTNKNFVITGGYLWYSNSYVTIESSTVSYSSLVGRSATLVYRQGSYSIFDSQNYMFQMNENDIILAIVRFTNDGLVSSYIYKVNLYSEWYNELNNLSNNKPYIALDYTGSLTIDITNKNYVFTSGYLFYEKGYVNITTQNISYSSYLNATSVLYVRDNTLYISDIRWYSSQARDIIVSIVWFTAEGNIREIIYFAGKTNKDINSLNTRVTDLENAQIDTLPKSAKILMRVGCIGDSYTSGWINDNTHKNNPNYSWCKYMKQLTGNEWTNFGVSGSSTKSWMTGILGKLSEVQAQGNKCQAYVIGLMINDQNTGMSTYVQLGTSSDIGTDNDSYYAYYYKLINACLEVNPDAKIFCNTCPKTGGSFSSYNQAVVDIVTYCQNEGKQVFLNDLRNYNWSNPSFVADALNGHYTAIGYEYMAEIMTKAISDVINNNISDFQNVNLIPYDALEN